jgi:NAD(P)-dependent dehydrogenase (short-subunit alcohol dehydrogenase family)
MIVMMHVERLHLMDLGLTDRVVLVTGASGAIGAAMARTFAVEGARVALGYHTARDQADQLADEIERTGGHSLVVRHDLADPDSARAAVDRVSQTWGRLDVLAAGAWASPEWLPPDTPPESVPEQTWQVQVRTNVEGTASMIRAALPQMRAGGWGRIVLLSSGAADGRRAWSITRQPRRRCSASVAAWPAVPARRASSPMWSCQGWLPPRATGPRSPPTPSSSGRRKRRPAGSPPKMMSPASSSSSLPRLMPALPVPKFGSTAAGARDAPHSEARCTTQS